jgi:release factor glutamine methyltransferase
LRIFAFVNRFVDNGLMTIRELRTRSHQLFAGDAPVPSPTPLLDCECILADILSLSRSHLLAADDRPLTPEEESRFTECAEKRRHGLPVAYIINKKEFYGIDFFVNPDVLIPKADTELLVDKALSLIAAYKTDDDLPALAVADMCTGSGCIALSILLMAERQLTMTAIDISEQALAVARKNAAHLLPKEKERALNFVRSDLFSALSDEKFDFVLSNPPYVPSRLVDNLLLDGRSEPRLALDGGKDGLECIENLIVQSAAHIKKGGFLVLETGEYNHQAAKMFLVQHGFSEICTYTDLNAQERLITAKIIR